MKKQVGLMTLVLCLALVGSAFASTGHYKLSDDWQVGEYGVYVITAESSTNRVLVGASLNTGDPKHAWVNKDFGSDYTVRCDVEVLTWLEDADASRAGICGRLKPVGASTDNPTLDVGVCLLVHQTTDAVSFLNDKTGCGTKVTYNWLPRTWYTMEMTFSGNNVSGKITNKSDSTDTVDIPSWAIPTPANRTTGFAGITASTAAGQTVYYDNFEVLVGGNVVFSDDFEGTDEVPNAVGLTNNWVAGNAGYYIVDDGQLYAIATNGDDPKHLWYKGEISGGGSISADVTMLSWDTLPTQDHSRAGVALHIKPAGTAEKASNDVGINLLFHLNYNTVSFLNDLTGWGNAETFAWVLGTTYTFQMTSDGTNVTGSIGTHSMTKWAFPTPANRKNGFAGITASTQAGQITAYDNIVVSDSAGNVVFKDDFATFFSATDNWEVFQ